MKKYIYFPYHITPQYEKLMEASKILSSIEYAKEHKKNLDKVMFGYHQVPQYLQQKALVKLLTVVRSFYDPFGCIPFTKLYA